MHWDNRWIRYRPPGDEKAGDGEDACKSGKEHKSRERAADPSHERQGAGEAGWDVEGQAEGLSKNASG